MPTTLLTATDNHRARTAPGGRAPAGWRPVRRGRTDGAAPARGGAPGLDRRGRGPASWPGRG
ncbi:hypothetical protein, partial [Streptomyces celluloflavus]|uniref:hypothetical protein n=1 Tax=Streptomyces celluloflavus TaxID=58344 RepID=UPI0036C962F3